MVVSAERALLLITAVGATTISASYDAAKLNAYFAAKPGALAARAAELAGIAASTAATLAAAAAAAPPSSASEFWARDGTASAVAAAVERGGATFAKFGQAAAARPDLVTPPLALALRGLQERMAPFAGGREAVAEALRATGPPDLVAEVLATLEGPVAAASVGQVYRATLGSRPIALKVRRPRVLETVAADAALARGAAALLQPLARTDLVGSCDEFFSRLFEECDYAREVENARTFRGLYGVGVGSAAASLPKIGGLRGVVVPEMVEALCGEAVVAMDWVDGERLDGVLDGAGDRAEDLELLDLGIRCTLSQLLETGVLHADPHGGNLRKVRDGGACRLAYLDFGLLATVPEPVRDGLVCAVALLCFARDVDAVAALFGELMLLPPEVLEDPEELAALRAALAATVDDVLVFPGGRAPPALKFDRLLDARAGVFRGRERDVRVRNIVSGGATWSPVGARAPRAALRVPAAALLCEQRARDRRPRGHGQVHRPGLQHPLRGLPLRPRAAPAESLRVARRRPHAPDARVDGRRARPGQGARAPPRRRGARGRPPAPRAPGHGPREGGPALRPRAPARLR